MALNNAISTFKIEVVIMEETKAVIEEGDENCEHRYIEEKKPYWKVKVLVQRCDKCGRTIF